MTRPLLNPPCPNWKEDLPDPHAKPNNKKFTGRQTPNHIDTVYLEFPRSSSTWRGAVSLTLIPAFYLLLGAPRLIIDIISTRELTILPLAIVSYLFLTWLILIGLRMDLCPPRDQPIRFNRIRQRVYAYNFIHCWWNPLGNWKVSHVSYEWSQARAERWLQRVGSMTKQGVVLSIVDPRSNKVIDRFPLTCMGSDQYAWAYICTYMQEGPSALPPPGIPKDHNDVLWYEFALRLAPKVMWPPEMDLESRTAP
ncbi:DUF6708 domain-containing protein [Pseudomonas sp. NPDC089401]|uniref:DUF6708 domain-containing protein n=1 Tax=Pseudomonas sp. NPDC089401 TaxID=3364462 RepID=UPI0038167C7F